MISNKWKKLVKSLQYKKYRKEHQLFLVEGAKSVLEVLQYTPEWSIEIIFVTTDFANQYTLILDKMPIEIVAETELNQIGSLQQNQHCLAVVRQKQLLPTIPKDDWVVCLDNIQDPGNLGTIIRICDWYGIKHLVCSPNTVEMYNPKTIGATMGSFLRVHTYYIDLPLFLSNATLPIFGTTMGGENIYKHNKLQKSIIVMGNEASGIQEETKKHIKNFISIPKFGGAESLNVGIATAVVVDNFFRNQ